MTQTSTSGPRILIDARPLQGPSGARGIGSYVRGLLAGLLEQRFDHNVSLSFTNVAGGYYGTYVIESSALSTLDSQGRAVTLPDVAVIMEAHRCIQPRGTCPPKKVYLSGTLTIQ